MASKAKGSKPTVFETKTIVRNGENFTEVTEGLARIIAPIEAPIEAKDKTTQNSSKGSKGPKSDEDEQKVFYNPIQQFNRDLTVLAIKAYGEEVVAKRQKNMEKRWNKNKRKRLIENDDRPQKQAKAEAAEDQGSFPGSADGEVAASNIEPMDTSEPPNVQLSSDVQKPKDVVTKTETTETNAESSAETADGMNTEFHHNGGSGQREPGPPQFTILDALSATGLRALRYVKELPFVTSVTANDLTASAVEAIKRNAEHNGVESKINAIQSDARAHMYSLIAEELTREHSTNPRNMNSLRAGSTKKYDVIDLDPYGTAATFLDAAVHAVRDDGGLLCVTCTDSGVWASHGYSEKAFSLYGGVPVKGFFSHEAGLRLVLNALATTAARHGLVIEPLLSLSIDYYVRIFVRIRKSPASVKFLAGKTMVVYNCDQGCGAWETQLLLRNKKVANAKGSGHFYKHGLSMGPTADQLCKHCNSKMHMAGPMYAGPLHSPDFIKRILDDLPNAPTDVYGTTTRIEGMLQTALDECSLTPPRNDNPIKDDELAAVEPYPFFFHPTMLAGAVHCSCPDEDSFRGALRGLGYEMTRSHCKPGSIKTNAPWSVIWHVMREWVRQRAPVKLSSIKENSAAYRLLRLDRKSASEVDGEKISTEMDVSEGASTSVKESASETNSKQSKDDDIDKLEVVFDKLLGQDRSKKGLVRYQMNPKENWGPLSKAKGH